MVLPILAGAALLVALLAYVRTRSLSRRLDGLNQSYWELRYDYTRLRSQVSRLDPEQEPPAPPPPAESVQFVPLSSIRKKDA